LLLVLEKLNNVEIPKQEKKEVIVEAPKELKK